MESIKFDELHPWALLTGAGFSANWGAPTAQAVWSEILSHPAIQGRDDVRLALLDRKNGFNFEQVLDLAQRGEFGPDGAVAMNEAVNEAYDGIARSISLERKADCHYLLAQFLIRGRTSFVFTLNQDMLLEGLANLGHGSWVDRPGVTKPPRGPSPEGWTERNPDYGDPDQKVEVDALEREPAAGWPHLEGQAHYIKLHGSYDWLAPDGSGGMILGGGKEDAIERRPLLRFYSQVFSSYINSGDKRLLVIGYGFGDGHINQTLARAVRHSGLRLHICDTRSPQELLNSSFGACFDCQTIWSGLCGYSTDRLSAMRQLESDMFVYPSPHLEGLVQRVLGKEFVPWDRHTHRSAEFGWTRERPVLQL